MVPEANPVSAVSSCMTVHVHAYACENGMYNVYVCACVGAEWCHAFAMCGKLSLFHYTNLHSSNVVNHMISASVMIHVSGSMCVCSF